MLFESFVNSERCKTNTSTEHFTSRLRALLIQKDVKLTLLISSSEYRLRALLIQKDVKHLHDTQILIACLRALLIQKDVKPFISWHFLMPV